MSSKSGEGQHIANHRVAVFILGTLAITLLATAYLAFTVESATSPGNFVRPFAGINNFVELTGSHIFRVAIRNTLYLWLRLSLIVALLSRPILFLLTRNRWTRGATAIALVLLLLIPIYSVWRPLFQSYNLLYPHRPAMIAIGFVQLLRIVPIVLVFLLLRANSRLIDLLLAAPAITLLYILFDPTVPIELTGGAPMMSTHTWGSWAWQLGYASRQYGQSAAAFLGMGPFLLASVGALWLLEVQQRPTRRSVKFMLMLLLIGIPILRLLVLWVVDGV